MRCPLCRAPLIQNDSRCPRCDALVERMPFTSLNLDDSPEDLPESASGTCSTKVELGGDARIVGALGGDFESWSESGEWSAGGGDGEGDAFIGLSAEDYLGASTGVVDRTVVLAHAGAESTPHVYVDDGVARLLKPEAVLSLSPGDDGALSPFERHVAGFLDGERPIARVARKANVSIDDARIALALLIDKRRALLVGHMIVPERFCEPRPTPPPVARAKPPPLPGDAAEDGPLESARPPMRPAPRAPARAASPATSPPAKSPPVRPFDPAKRAPMPGFQRYGEQQDVRLLRLAMQKEELGLYDDAVRLLRKAIEVSPQAAVLYNRLGVVLATRLKDYTAASQVLFQACELEPNNDTYMANLAKVAERHEAAQAKAERDKASFTKGLFRRRR